MEPDPPESKLLVIIPAYNEAASIRAVIDDLREHVPSAELAVVDDGSTDGTAEIAAAAGATVLRLPFNLGIGGALQTGYLYAMRSDCGAAVQFDGDGQHRADQIPALVAELSSGAADLVVGSRTKGAGAYRFPLMRGLGSRLIRTMTNLATGLRIEDPTSGFRAFSRRAIAFFARHYPQSYLESPQAIVWAARQGMVVREVPVEMRRAGHSSIGNLAGVWHAMRVCMAILIDRLESRFPDGRPDGKERPE